MARLRRLSRKKQYKVEFYSNSGSCESIIVEGASSILECATKCRRICKFVPLYMRVTDVKTGDTVEYMLYLQPGFPRD